MWSAIYVLNITGDLKNFIQNLTVLVLIDKLKSELNS